MRTNRITLLYVGLFILTLNAMAFGEILDISATMKEWILPNNSSSVSMAANPSITDQTMMNQVVNAAIVSQKGYTLQYPLHLVIEVRNGKVDRFFMETLQPIINNLTTPSTDGPSTMLVMMKHIRNGNREYGYLGFPDYAGGVRQMIYEDTDLNRLAAPTPMNIWYAANEMAKNLLALKDSSQSIVEDHESYFVVKRNLEDDDPVLIDKQMKWVKSKNLQVEFDHNYNIPATLHMAVPGEIEKEFHIDSIQLYQGDESIFSIPEDQSIQRYNGKTQELIKANS